MIVKNKYGMIIMHLRQSCCNIRFLYGEYGASSDLNAYSFQWCIKCCKMSRRICDSVVIEVIPSVLGKIGLKFCSTLENRISGQRNKA